MRGPRQRLTRSPQHALASLVLISGVLIFGATGCPPQDTNTACPSGQARGDDDECHPRCGAGDTCPNCLECRGGLCYPDPACGASLCGNGELEVGEECDDGNTLLEACPAADPSCLVCGPLCTLLPGGPGTCGNEVVEVGEECDDGNAVTEACPYGQTDCTVCDEHCQEVSGVSSYCGDGVVDAEAGETCDDGGTGTGNGCDASCQVEIGWGCDTSRSPTVCALLPAPPVIDGEPSAGHDHPTWTWTAPIHAQSYRFRLGSGAWQATTVRRHTATDLTPGSYTLEVMACNHLDLCSSPASFVTVVEFFGQQYPGVWQGVAKPDLATTAIGNVVPISCHNCYNGPNNEVYGTSAALAKIGNAITRNADLIELDIADTGGTLCVYHGDSASCAGAPTLQSILADSTLKYADALLFVEIKEGNAVPADFARSLLDLLDANREVVRNGRPLILRAFASRRDYLLAIQAVLDDYPMIAPYLRFSVLYGKTGTAVSTLQGLIARDVAGAGFHMVELYYQQKNLAGLAKYAQSLGLAVGLWTIPGPFGEVFLASLREEVDQLTAEYRIDQARLVVEEANTYAHLNVWDCISAADPTVSLHRNASGTRVTEQVTVGQAPTAGSTGTPPLNLDAVGEDRFGCSLDFRQSQGITERALSLGQHHPGPNAGYLVMAIVNFDTLAGLNGTQAILNSSEAGGFALELSGNGTTTNLRFGVHVNGAYRFHSYNVAGTGLASNIALNGTDSYVLVGAYDGDGGVYLWVDGEILGNGGSHVGEVTNSGQPALVGADPQPSETVGARSFFNGQLQQAMLLRWEDHSFTGSRVND